MGARGLHRHGGIGADGGGRGGGAHPGGGAARPAFGIGGQRRVVRAVIGRLVADDVDDRRLRAAGVVQIGQTVRQARVRNAAVSPPACRTCARSRRRRRSPRPRTGPARSACRARDRAPRRSASRTCRGWRSRYRRRSSAVCGRDFRRRSWAGPFGRGVFGGSCARVTGAIWQPRGQDRAGERVDNPVGCSAGSRASPALSSMYSVRVGKANSTPASFTRSMICKRIASRSRNSLV